jgi:hypothetical protein
MQMSNGTKFNLLIALSFIGIWTCNYFMPKKTVDEIVIDNIHIPRKPCINIVNELFGKGVDSLKVCDCLIPKFYKLIEKDSTLVERFKQSDGIFKLEGSMQDSATLLFANCVRPNIIDTNFKFHLTPEYSLAFKEKLKKGFELRNEFKNEFKNIDAEAFSNCIVEKLNGNITVGEYFSDDYFEVPKIKKIMTECITQSIRPK